MAKYFCPECEVPLTKGEHARGVCPVCAAPTVPTGDPVPLPVQPIGESKAGKLSEAAPAGGWFSPAWHQVQRGLRLIKMTLVLVPVGGIFVVLISLWLLVNNRLIDDGLIRTLPRVLGMALGWPCFLSILLLAGLLDLIGRYRCSAVPKSSGARGLAQCMVACHLLIAALVVVRIFYEMTTIPGDNRDGRLLLFVYLLLFAFSFLSLVFFLYFLRRIALYFGNNLLARNCTAYLMYFVFFLFGILACFCYFNMVLANAYSRDLLAFVATILVVGGVSMSSLVMYLWHLRLITETRDTIRRAVGTPADHNEY